MAQGHFQLVSVGRGGTEDTAGELCSPFQDEPSDHTNLGTKAFP